MASLDDSEATEVNVATTNEEFARNTSDESVGNDSDVFFEQPVTTYSFYLMFTDISLKSSLM